MSHIKFLFHFVSDLCMHYIHFIFSQTSFHVAINDSETQAILLFFRMEKSVDNFNLQKTMEVYKTSREMLLSFFLTCSTRSPPASRTNA